MSAAWRTLSMRVTGTSSSVAYGFRLSTRFEIMPRWTNYGIRGTAYGSAGLFPECPPAAVSGGTPHTRPGRERICVLAVRDSGRQIVAEQLYATLKTNHGDIVIRLLPNHSPTTVQ